MDESTPRPTTSPQPRAGGSWPAFAARARVLAAPFGMLLRVPGHMLTPAPRPTTPLAPPAGPRWTAFAACGPVLVVAGVLLHPLGHAGTGNFFLLVGACVGFKHLYLRHCGLDVVHHMIRHGNPDQVEW